MGNPGTSTLTVTPSGTIASSFITNPATGTATPVLGVLTFAGTSGVTVSAAGSTVTIAGPGSGFASSFPTDSGTATPAAGVLNVFGGGSTNIQTAGSGNTITMDYKPVSSFTADFNTEANITGDGTIALLGATAAATVLTNVGSDFFAGDGVGAGASYTVPVTGLYYIFMYTHFTVGASATAGVDFSLGLAGASGFNFSIGPTSNACAGYANNSGAINMGGSCIVRLTGGGVVNFTVQSNGNAKNLTVNSGTVGGYLISL